MRLKSVYISQYKNLCDFTLNFAGDSFIDVFVGKNGSGKSNFFEALIEIFRHIAEYDKSKEPCPFNYEVRYDLDGSQTTIAWRNNSFLINGRKRKTIRNTPRPDNVLVYYSGHNDTVSGLIDLYEDAFRKRIKRADFDESRYFIGVGPEYKELLLAMLLMQPEENKARQFIQTKLGISSIAPEVRLKLVRPVYASGPRFDIDDLDEDRYWKPAGITKSFLDRLKRCITTAAGGVVRSEGYFATEDYYTHYFSIDRIRAEFRDYSSQELFRQFDNIKTLGMLAEINIPVTLNNGTEASISFFSDGQFQSVYIYSIVELFNDRNCITLLDEPDSFLHPEWQFGFIEQVFEITEATAKNNHVLLSSHSAATVCNFDEQYIGLFSVGASGASCGKKPKKDVIRELSGSLIQYSEAESRLLIDNVIRTSTRPILFVEGVSDVNILNTAYEKLYPGEDIPILIQDAFDHGFIKTLFARDDIYRNHPNKHFFALFDFDKAYENWRDLGGDYEVNDIGFGLCRRLSEKKAHTFMLPIPNNPLRQQVWDESNPTEKIKPNPCFGIEHIFWEALEGAVETWFKIDSGGIIRFRKDDKKVKFSQEVVRDFDRTHFEIFRPMFELIKAKCEE